MSYIPTVVYGHMHKAIFELMRRNPSGAAPHVQVFVELARQHVMGMEMPCNGLQP